MIGPAVNLLQYREPFGSFSQSLGFQMSRKNIFYFFEDGIVFLFHILSQKVRFLGHEVAKNAKVAQRKKNYQFSNLVTEITPFMARNFLNKVSNCSVFFTKVLMVPSNNPSFASITRLCIFNFISPEII